MIRIVLAICIGLCTTAVRAQDVFVQSSTTDGIRIGQTMACDAPLDLPAGAVVRLLNAQGSAVERCGPYKGPAMPCQGASSGALKRLFSVVGRDQFFNSVGAVRAGPAEIISTCSAASKAQAELDIEADRTYCAAGNRPPPCLYIRPNAGLSPFALSASDGGLAKVQLAEGQTEVDWPESLPFKSGVTYTVATSDEPQVNVFTVAAMPKGAGQKLVIAMAEQGCDRQAAQALLQLR